MPKILFDILIYTLALFGALMLTISIVKTVSNRLKHENQKVRLILMVKDQEEQIEGIVRSVFTGDLLYGTLPGNNLIILDMGSQDDTLKIVEKLKRDYQYIDIIRKEEKEKAFLLLEQ
jgi:hypothetical protein